jgi:hypothetical protein
MRPSRCVVLAAVMTVLLCTTPAAADQHGTLTVSPNRHLVAGQTVTATWSGLFNYGYGAVYECPYEISEYDPLAYYCRRLAETDGPSSGSVEVTPVEGALVPGREGMPWCPPNQGRSGQVGCPIIVANTFCTPTSGCTTSATPAAKISFADTELRLSPQSGPPGTNVTAEGVRFLSGESVKVFYKTGLGAPRKILVCSATAGAHGFFACTGTMPTTNTGPRGSHRIVAKAASGRATATFTVT